MPVQKKSLKPIPPTLREKKRYIFFELQCDSALKKSDVNKALWNAFFELFGQLGAAEINPQLIEFDSKKNSGILKCSRNNVEKARTALLFLKKVSGKNVIPKTLKTSGTLKKLRS